MVEGKTGMKGAWFGFYALTLICMNIVFLLLERLGWFPFFATPLFPLVLLFSFIIGMLGAFEKDRRKVPGFAAMGISSGLFIYWVVMLVQRLSA